MIVSASRSRLLLPDLLLSGASVSAYLVVVELVEYKYNSECLSQLDDSCVSLRPEDSCSSVLWRLVYHVCVHCSRHDCGGCVLCMVVFAAYHCSKPECLYPLLGSV